MKALRMCVAAMVAAVTATTSAAIPDQVRVENGLVSGVAGISSGVRAFKGMPYAAPPVGANRWRAPQPAANWDGVRAGNAFGNRCIAGGGGGGRGGGRGAAPGAPAAPAARPGSRAGARHRCRSRHCPRTVCI